MDKPVIKQKPKPPPYPRPVPQLVIEELPPGPKDLAWNAINGGGYYIDEDQYRHDEAETERRAAKRRKIEACAHACLRGQSLFIMSAQLKGPFKKDWKNPWAKRRRTNVTAKVPGDKQVEIPETARKIPSSVEEEKTGDVKNELQHPRPASPAALQSKLPHKDAMVSTAPSPFTSRAKKASLAASPQVPRQVKDSRVKEWLRTNRTAADDSEDEILVHSSPTPMARQRRTSNNWQDTDNRFRTSQSEPSRIVSPYQNSPKTVTSLQDQGLGRLSGAEKRIQQLSRNIQNIITEPVAPSSVADHRDDVGEIIHAPSDMKSFFGSSRAEFAILQAKRNVPQTAPANAHLSPFEFRKVHDNTGHAEQQIAPAMNARGTSLIALRPNSDSIHFDQRPIVSNSDHTEPSNLVPDGLETTIKPSEDIFLTAPQTSAYDTAVPRQDKTLTEMEEIATKDLTMPREADPTIISSSRPGLSNAVSEAGTTDLLPSAQPRIGQDQALSSITHDDKLRSIKHTESVPEHTAQNGVKAADEASEPKPDGHEIQHEVHSGHNRNEQHETTVDITEESTPFPAHNAQELNTQEMLANIEPLDLSTVKKPRYDATKETPVATSKMKSDKKRKKTSFVLETSSTPSHTSIKDIMKAKVSKNTASPPMFVFSKEDLDIEVSDDENESRQKRSRNLSSISKPKSILKSTNLSSSPTSARKSRPGLSNGHEQSGPNGGVQPPGSGQNGMEDDKFDLDAAIDDLGSFLGTWDAEKEASSLEIEL